ncbi:MAG: PTS sugar transporter subunit IIB [Leptolinea sp.]|jgi:PTS system cellobiose-specific IIB component|nr:PTS sugar transporter subunit IIB [Leptolinea sp.]
MYRIAMICENGASTGLCMRKMTEYAKRAGIDCEISAYAKAQLADIVDEMDCLLLGPQIAFKMDSFKSSFPEHASKFAVVNSMDFGMMNGEKILNAAITLIEKNKKGMD